MAIDITVYPELSPRVIVVDDPQTEASVQEIIDAIRDWEDSEIGVSYPVLIDAAGKEDLGGGVLVGITATLQNARLRFAARTIPLTSGTITSDNTKGDMLIDSGADFVAAGVYKGATVFNNTTGSMETIIDVDTTTLKTFVLQGGTRQDWQIGDSYSVYPNQLCNISGGNLVAIDEDGNNIDPVFQAPNINVIRSSASSATTSDLDAIQYASYQNAVWLDNTTSITGIAYPSGTREFPVNNLTDAVVIANSKGFSTIQVLSSMTLDGGNDLNNFEIVGQSHVTTEITIAAELQCENITIRNCNITGVLDGGTYIKDCVVKDIDYVNGHIHDCGLEGTIGLAGAQNALIANCYQSGTVTPILDIGAAGQNLSVVGYTGRIVLQNSVSPANVMALGVSAGQIIIDPTITAGVIIVTGIGAVVNNGTPTLLSTDGLMSKETISESVLNTELAGFDTDFTVASSLRLSAYANQVTIDTVNGTSGTSYPIGTAESPVSNLGDAVIIAEENGLKNLYFKSNYTFDNTVFILNYNLIGEGLQRTLFTCDSGCILGNCQFYNAAVTGDPTGVTGFQDCFVYDFGSSTPTVGDVDVIATRCLFDGDIILPSNYTGTLKAIDCWSNVPGSNTPVLDLGGSTANLIARNYSGGIELKNMTEPIQCSVDLVSGQLKVDSSCTDGFIVVRGVGQLTDNSTGTTIDSTGLMSKNTISEAVLNTELIPYVGDDTVASALKFAAYGNKITIDAINGETGTAWPIGTLNHPVDNLDDAITIAEAQGFKTLFFLSDYIFDNTVNIVEYTLQGRGKQDIIFTFESGCQFNKSAIEDATVTGNVFGISRFTNCILDNVIGDGPVLSTLEVVIADCLLKGTNGPASTYLGSLKLTNCSAAEPTDSIPIFDVNNANCTIITRNYSGGVKVINLSDAALELDLISGYIELDSSCTSGTVNIRGIGNLLDNSTGSIVDSTGLISKSIISEAVWDEAVDNHAISGSSGRVLKELAFRGRVHIDENSAYSTIDYPNGTEGQPVNNLAAAKIIALSLGFNTFEIEGAFTLDDDYSNWNFIGSTNFLQTSINLNNYDISGSSFDNVTLLGSQNGNIIARRSTINGSAVAYTGINGVYEDSYFLGEISFDAGDQIIAKNISGGGTGGAIIDIKGAGSVLTGAALTGNWVIKNTANGIPFPSVVSLDYTSGSLVLDSTCTGGAINIAGLVEVTDNTGPACIVNRRAQLQASPSAYEGAVWIDVANGAAGTNYPLGTSFAPVNNLADALVLASQLNIKAFNVRGLLSLTQDFEGYLFYGLGNLGDDALILNDISIDGSSFDGFYVTGVSSGSAIFENCLVENLYGISGILRESGVSGTIALSNAGSTLQILKGASAGNPTIIDMVGSGRILQADIVGNVKIKNAQGTPAESFVQVGCSWGDVVLDSTCAGGTILLQGNTSVTDQSAGSVVVDKTLAGLHGEGNWEGAGAADNVAAAVWDRARSLHTASGTFGATDEWASSVDVESIADAVWDEIATEHVEEGSMGELQTTGGGGAEAIADAVWDEASEDHGDDNTMGRLQNKLETLVAAKPKIIPGE